MKTLRERLRELRTEQGISVADIPPTDNLLAVLELAPGQWKIVVAYLTNDEATQSITHLWHATGQTFRHFERLFNDLAERGLVRLDGNVPNFDALLDKIKLELEPAEGVFDPPRPVLVLRGLQYEALRIVRGATSDAAGLGRVYEWVYGQKPHSYGVLGKIAKLLGRDRAALFLLRHVLTPIDGNRETALLAMATVERSGPQPPEHLQNVRQGLRPQRSRGTIQPTDEWRANEQ